MNINIKDTYFGYTDKFSPMQKRRRENSLDTSIRYEGRYMREKEFIYMKLLEGYRPGIEENYSYYSRRKGEMTKPKTLYKLEKDDSYFEITKTSYEFAQHVLSNDFIYEDKAKAYIENEKRQKEEQERLKREEEIQKRKQQEELRAKEEKERQEKLARWRAIGEKLFDDRIKNIIVEVLNNHKDDIKKQMPLANFDEQVNRAIKNFPQYFGNKEYMKSHAQYLMENGNNRLEYRIEKEIFMKIFNLNEGDSARSISMKVTKFYKNIG